ncbi:HAMP domain-containing sensor histidine kinase [Eubacterium sp. 1001713B170207_170306_E7]|uniref:sensor histidine kinase n=1 Tax=Eubacterium sp. 1001713B170207_170306_E7 TaxID=2787097 RepID=UPI0018973CC1|nr:HAMP domain-containing sensor histidine kinase [Eubacterium sp. 1001713B170207_170306_E7]
MRFLDYVKDKLLFLAVSAVLLLFMGFSLELLRVDRGSRLYLMLVLGFALALIFLAEYFMKAHFYKDVCQKLDRLDKKYLLSELISRPAIYEGRILYDVLKAASKSMNDEIAVYRHSSNAYREYIETWVHEVKTPIASAGLIIENHQNPVTLSIGEEIDQIEGYVNQALFYSRSSGVEKDYVIRRTLLQDLVNPVLRKTAKTFISRKIRLSTSGLDRTVFTDPKWTDFILGQLLDNALKYLDENAQAPPEITISAMSGSAEIILSITDNGIGIPPEDIDRIFDKGFTGSNGRQGSSKATGIGLYLCKKLCGKLGLGLSVESQPGRGTTAAIHFPVHEQM